MKTEKSLTDRRYLYRNSGIELLKIIAIILIAINHTTQSVQSESLFPFQNALDKLIGISYNKANDY